MADRTAWGSAVNWEKMQQHARYPWQYFKQNGTGALFGKTGQGLVKGLEVSGLNSIGWLGITAGTAAVSAALAPRHRRVSAFASSIVPWTLGAMVGGAVAGSPGAMVGGFLANTFLEKPIGDAVQAFAGFHERVSRVRMGGDYTDTARAYTMRQVAAREMAGSLMNARQWLGQESIMFHS